jgi:cytochrome c-type biogenesis protein CcmH/NrfG
MSSEDIEDLVNEATFDYATGDGHSALAKLERAVRESPNSAEAWHTLAEVRLGSAQLDGALAAAERAHALLPKDLLINTTLSRIWMERGDKAKAEHFGAQAKIEGWKEELRSPEPV